MTEFQTNFKPADSLPNLPTVPGLRVDPEVAASLAALAGGVVESSRPHTIERHGAGPHGQRPPELSQMEFGELAVRQAGTLGGNSMRGTGHGL